MCRNPGLSRKAARKPVGGAGSAAAAAAAAPAAADAGSRIALAASADACWRACAAPITPAAPWSRSPANCRKKRRLPRSAASGSASGVDTGASSVLDDAGDSPSIEALPTLEELELDEERETDDLALEPLDELDRPLHGPARRQQVVDDQHLLARLDRVAVDLERVRAVLERVLDRDGLGRQL